MVEEVLSRDGISRRAQRTEGTHIDRGEWQKLPGQEVVLRVGGTVQPGDFWESMDIFGCPGIQDCYWLFVVKDQGG